MNWIDQTVAEFGESIGIPALALDAQNQVCMELQSGGEIRIDYLSEPPFSEIVVSRSQPLEPEYSTQLREALRLTDFRCSDRWAVNATVYNDQLVLGMRIPEREFELNVLEDALSQLTQMHQYTFNRR